MICGGALLLVPLSPCLIFGIGPLPALAWRRRVVVDRLLRAGHDRAGLVLRERAHAGPARARAAALGADAASWPWAALPASNPVLTNGLIGLTASIVGAHASTAALAGYAAVGGA